tara:strand:+ start:899 stop:1699 length:801 start_codon:yes stop_codon:yes gene_type:complete
MKTKYNRIGVKAIDRGGSNLILALFHYHDEFYSLSEKTTCDINDIETLLCMRTSVFSDHNMHKSISTSKNLVQKIPRKTSYPYGEGSFKYDYCNYEYDKTLCVLRNPFRVAISSYNKWFAEADLNQKSPVLLNKLLNSSISWTNERLREIKNKEIDNFISLEYFVNNFEIELPKLISWADKDSSPIISRDIGQLYFKPLIDSEKLRFAGNFDPLVTIKLERLISDKIIDYFSINDILTAGEKLPRHLFEYWHNDLLHSYKVNINLA